MVLSDGESRELQLFKRQYLQLHPGLVYPSPDSLRQQFFQDALYANVFREEALPHHPPERFRLRVMKELMNRIESSIVDWEEDGISDDLSSCLAVLLCSSIPPEMTSTAQRAYVTYTMSGLKSSETERTVTLLESRNVLAASGTTGFRTWEASLHLASYLCSSKHIVSLASKSVLELGAGSGFLSILCSKHLEASYVVATDGSDDVVDNMSTNFYLNGLQDSTKIVAQELKWGQALLGTESESWNHGRHFDVVLGADVTFDARGIPALVATLRDLTDMFPAVDIIIASTIRNTDTFETFQTACTSNGFVVDVLEFPIRREAEQVGPFYSDKTPIQISSVRKTSEKLTH